MASQELRSATYELTADLDGKAADVGVRGTLKLKGTLQQGGKENQFNLQLDGTAEQKGSHYAFKADADLASEANGDFSFFLRSAQMDPPHPLLKPEVLSRLLGKWWKIPSGQKDASPSVTPDPRLLRAQSEVVSVTRDRGLDTIDGADAYHYDVAIDPQKFIAFLRETARQKGDSFDPEAVARDLGAYTASGELWIDAKTFYVHRLSWHIQNARSDAPATLTLSIRADLRDHDKAVPIVFPKGAQEFPRGHFLEGILGAGSGTLSGSTTTDALPPSAQMGTDGSDTISVMDLLKQQGEAASIPGGALPDTLRPALPSGEPSSR